MRVATVPRRGGEGWGDERGDSFNNGFDPSRSARWGGGGETEVVETWLKQL